MIEVKFNFPNPAEAAAFLVSVQNFGVHAGSAAPGLALESGEFIPANELNKPVAAPKSVKKAEAKPAPAAEPAEAPASAASTATPSDSQPTTVEYPVLQKAVFTLAGKSRDAAAEVAASMGVKTFKELPAEKWGDALAAVNAKIAELG